MKPKALLQSKKIWVNKTGPDKNKLKFIDDYAIGKSVIDIGCSNGFYSEYVKKNGYEVLAVDIEDYRKIKSTEFVQINPGDLSSVKGTYDTALAFDVIEHVRDDVDFMKQLKKYVNQRIIGSVPHDNDEIYYRYGVSFKHRIDKTHYREYSKDTLNNLFQSINPKKISIVEGSGISPMIVREFFGVPLLKITVSILMKIFIKIGLAKSEKSPDLYFVIDL